VGQDLDPLVLVARLREHPTSEDARARRRTEIARAFLRAGDRASAAEWYLKAAAHAEFSELANTPLVYARRALELVPDDPIALGEVERLRRKYGV
jgi:hypothetical protein